MLGTARSLRNKSGFSQAGSVCPLGGNVLMFRLFLLQR